MKACKRCDEVKPLDEFYRDLKAKDGSTSSCRECVKKATRDWNARNGERNREKVRQWKAANPEKVNAQKGRQKRRQRARDPQIPIRNRISGSLWKLLNGLEISGPVVDHLGCSSEELAAHIEKQFRPGMCWGNHTYVGWHIDHIKPLSSFDLTDPVQLAEACHYTNLQPLWAVDNLKKGARYELQER